MPTALLQRLREIASQYVDGSVSAEDLRGHLADLVIPMSKADDPLADELESLIWLMISELDRGHRTEPSMREEIREALASPMQVNEPPSPSYG